MGFDKDKLREPDGGMKDDALKSRVELIPSEPLIAIGEVLGYGAIKYEEDSWKKLSGLNKRYSGAMLRHYLAWNSGEEIDLESGLHHLAHMATNALFLLRNAKKNKSESE